MESPTAQGIGSVAKALQEASPMIKALHGSPGMMKALHDFGSVAKALQGASPMLEASSMIKAVQNIIASSDLGQFDENFENLSVNDKEEITNAVVEVFDEQLNFQQHFMKRFEIFKAKNPILARAFILLISLIFVSMINITGEIIKDTVIRKEPLKTSPIVQNINITQKVTIINDAPYYYEVTISKDKNGETLHGWISKRSIRLQIQETDITFCDNDDDIECNST